MKTPVWLVLPFESEVLREALWSGYVEHDGKVCRATPRELIVEGSQRKVLLLLDEFLDQRQNALSRWWTALRVEKSFFVAATAVWVLLLGLGQHWELKVGEGILACVGSLSLYLAVSAFAEIYDTLRLLDLRRWYGPDQEQSAILRGWVSPQKLWFAAWVLMSVALACGIPLIWWNSQALLPMAAMAAVAAWGYAQPPLALKYRGWGEVVLFLASGPALALGFSWCLFSQWNGVMISLGACVGFWNLTLHHLGNLPDFDQDREHGVSTWVTQLGFRRARNLVPVLYFMSWASFFPAVFFVGMNPILVFALALLLIPQLRLAFRVLRASGGASVWMAGVRGRSQRVHAISYVVAVILTSLCIQLFGGVT